MYLNNASLLSKKKGFMHVELVQNNFSSLSFFSLLFLFLSIIKQSIAKSFIMPLFFAFCMQLCRTFAFEVGIDPSSFRVLQSTPLPCLLKGDLVQSVLCAPQEMDVFLIRLGRQTSDCKKQNMCHSSIDLAQRNWTHSSKPGRI